MSGLRQSLWEKLNPCFLSVLKKQTTLYIIFSQNQESGCLEKDSWKTLLAVITVLIQSNLNGTHRAVQVYTEATKNLILCST